MSEKKKLTRAERKQIEAAIARANRTDKKEKSAQDSIPYQRMWPDGICRVTDTRYTKTIQYQDINYQLSQNEDKTAIFEAWCDFLNYFDSSVQFQLSFVNLSASQETFARSISIPPCGDEFDGIRAEYAGMLQNQLARGNNGLIKTKYLTFGVEADNLRAAKPRLERIETDLLNNFKRLGVVAAPLNGFERLHVMHDILRMDEQEPFRFSWDWLAPSGLSTKDFIAPSSFEFKTGRMFRMGKKLGAISFVQILAPELNDRMLADFLDMESSVLVNLHVQSVDQVNAIKTVKRKITDLDKSKIEEQKKAVRAGYDMDIIPSDLATYGAEAKKLLQDLQSRNERMFLLTFLILNTADTPRQLDNNIFQTSSIVQKYNCALTRLDFQQEEGLMSSLPLGLNQIEIQRGLTTSSVAIFVPFTTQELFQNGSEALYYGINALSNNLIMVDRKLLKNPNGLILGTPGSGKSFSAKREITNAFLICPKDDIIICDPEGEYTPLVERLHGQVIKLSPTGKGYDGSPCYINPMDLNLDYSDDDNPLSLKSDFILSLCELIVGGKDGLAPVEKTIIDRCVRIVYRDYVTEGTFDAYLWQTVENKQKFISQIMTSKSPVRSCEDVDATALSFAEIKALCAGDPRIKERMDLDIEVSKLKIMKADHNSKQFRLEDSLLKYFPEKIEEHKGFVRGLEADMQTLAAHPLPAEGFVGMEIRGDRLTDKENAGAALLDTCKEVKGKDPVQIGSYRGFTMSVAFDSMWKTYTLTLKGQMTHRVELGSDARGNLVRIENALDKMPERLRSVQEQLENLYNQQAAAKAEVGKPFPQEQELAAKTARLIELDMELNLDGKGQPQPEQAIAKSARPSVLDRLKASPVHGAPEKPHKKEMEAR